ncbi:immunoglobulin-like domain-containing protein [Enterococcus mundtii]|uniref:immunoglobulin-like domain-containing protein n=1 Tax=Enterococcus mundtii TaxID=53346 RepID=UPI000CF028EC|nr:immunoglobulin-like domain-containing protein [Enterococcus mundtii]PQC31751.1 hypothetical protein CUM97_05115 [Enterococcus mundtii]
MEIETKAEEKAVRANALQTDTVEIISEDIVTTESTNENVSDNGLLSSSMASVETGVDNKTISSDEEVVATEESINNGIDGLTDEMEDRQSLANVLVERENEVDMLGAVNKQKKEAGDNSEKLADSVELKEKLATELSNKRYYNDNLEDIAMKDVTEILTDSSNIEIKIEYAQNLGKVRKEQPDLELDEQKQIARKKTIDQLNSTITQLDEYEVITPQVADNFADKEVWLKVFNSNPSLTYDGLEKDLPSILRGMYYLTQQFNFEEGVARNFAVDPAKIDSNYDSSMTAYDRLKKLGGTKEIYLALLGYVNSKLGQLGRNIEQYTARGMDKITGYPTIVGLVSSRAKAAKKDTGTFLLEQSEAIIYAANQVNPFEVLSKNKPELILPILNQGSGIYVGITHNSLNVGMIDTYDDSWTGEKQHIRGTVAIESPYIKKFVDSFENFQIFLEDRAKSEVPFAVAIDSFRTNYSTNSGGEWVSGKGKNAPDTVKAFFTPMNYYISDPGFIGGQSFGPELFHSYVMRLMANDYQGVELYTHEMAHGNEKSLIGERRSGQGAEIYARGIYEDIVNTQKELISDTSNRYEPVFNLNTSIVVGDVDNRTQRSTPQTTKEELEKFHKNQLELVMYLEALEAEVMSELPEEIRNNYYSKVEQVSPLVITNNEIKTDQERIRANSTADKFSPDTEVGKGRLTVEELLEELVKGNDVSAGFTPRGNSPFHDALNTNQYDQVDLLNSFYGATANSGKNASGDISWKRKAYEILDLYGYDAFRDFISNKYSSDEEALNHITGFTDYNQIKIDIYKELLEKELNPSLGVLKEELKDNLKKAIQEDVVSIRAVRNNYQEVNQDSIVSDELEQIKVRTNYNITAEANAVQTVKLDILNKTLDFNELEYSVLQAMSQEETKGINSENTPILETEGDQTSTRFSVTDSRSFREALEKVIEINKKLTIEGNYHTISTRTPRIILNNDVVIRNLVIELQNNQHSGLFANGYSLTLDNVCSSESISTPLNIYGGSYKVPILDNREARIEIKGSNVINGSIYSGGYGQQASPTKTTVIIGEDVTKKIDTIYASGVDFSNYNPNDWFSQLGISSGANIYKPIKDNNCVETVVQLHTTSTVYNAIEGNDSTELQLFDNKYGFFDLRSSGINKISLMKGKFIPTTPSLIKEISLSLAEGSLLDLTNSNAFENAFIRNLQSDNGTIKMLDYGVLTLDSIESNSIVNVSTKYWINEEYFKIVVKSGGKDGQFISEDTDYVLKYDQGSTSFVAVETAKAKTEAEVATISQVDSQTTKITGTGEPGGKIELLNGNQLIAQGYVNPDGSYSLKVTKQPAGSTIVAKVTMEGKESQATTVVEEKNNLQVPVIDKFTEGDAYAKGTAGKDATKVAIFVNGVQRRIAAVSDGKYNIYANDLGLKVGDTFEIAGIASDGTIGPKTSSTVQENDPVIYGMTVEEYILGTNTVNGTAKSGIARVQLFVNGVVVRQTATSNGTYNIWGADVISSLGDKVEVVGLDSNGIERSRVTVKAMNAPVKEMLLTVNEYTLRDNSIKGTKK